MNVRQSIVSEKKIHNDISFEDTHVAFSYKSDTDLWKSYLLFASINRNWLVNSGTKLIRFALKTGLPIDPLLKTTLFKQFCGGENVEDCEKTVQMLFRYHVGTILDYSVEGEKTEEAFDETEKETMETIHKAASHHDSIPFSVFKTTGLASLELLEKVSLSLNNPTILLSAEEQVMFAKLVQRVDNICKTAYQQNVKIFIDAEETWIQDAIDELAYQMMAKYNREKVIVYNTYQLYTLAGLGKLKIAKEMGLEKGFRIGAKIVRGAYMEKERARAKDLGYADPIQPNKSSTDKAFNDALVFCIENKAMIDFCAGTHNEQSSLFLVKLMEQHHIAKNDPGVWFAQLFGMSDHISFNLAKAGYNVAKYVPYGPLKSVMPYLFRRAAENTSVAGQSSRELGLITKEVARRKRAKGKL
ncbi:MAG: proline dehydrogenase family protein [Thermoflexibacter sp.]|nr:proline dehydrogenase family protein [Thermoflexibacter sp.]